jgi:geranylgeranyl pyrophosphate synthase
MNQIEKSDHGSLREILSQPDKHTWSDIQPFLDRTDAIEYAQRRANQFALEARKQLSGLPNSAARTILEDLTEFACRRSS